MLLAGCSFFRFVDLASWSSLLWAILLLSLWRMASLGGYLASTGLACDVIRTRFLSLLGLLATLVFAAFLKMLMRGAFRLELRCISSWVILTGLLSLRPFLPFLEECVSGSTLCSMHWCHTSLHWQRFLAQVSCLLHSLQCMARYPLVVLSCIHRVSCGASHLVHLRILLVYLGV